LGASGASTSHSRQANSAFRQTAHIPEGDPGQQDLLRYAAWPANPFVYVLRYDSEMLGKGADC